MDFLNKLLGKKQSTTASSNYAQSHMIKTPTPDPTNEEEYVRRCLEVEFKEEQETRTFGSDPAFATVLTPLNAQQYTQVIKAGQSVLSRFPDFDLIYKWMGSAYRSTQQLQKSREILSEGIQKSKRKCLLLTDMGVTEWQSGNLHEAVYWLSQAIHNLYSNPIDYNAFLLLSYVAKGSGLKDFERALLAQVDSLKPGQVRLDPTREEHLLTLVKNKQTDVIRKALKKLQAKYY
jgi:tetratricopeptide (TPR) repeat protein